ncbi:MAG: DUF4338 domain-containing protein [Candidatus Aenigmarchaeota archaeon]|nr:DUF4338 domain-containing protein [Candidatus Aenigmarchaeota archaeon]
MLKPLHPQSGNRPRPEATPTSQVGDDGSNPPCRISLRLCSDRQDFEAFRWIIDTYHTYKPWKPSPGRKICWLIEREGETIGSIAVHSAVLTIKPREDFIGWDQRQKLVNLNKVANNYRFALIERGVGSRVLSELEREAKREWKRKYGDPLVLLETFVQPPYEGTSYKAANWTYIGMTKGFAVRRAPVSLWKRAGGERKKLWESDPHAAAKLYAGWNGGQLVKVTPTPKKHIFARPLHRYWRRELLRV